MGTEKFITVLLLIDKNSKLHINGQNRKLNCGTLQQRNIIWNENEQANATLLH